VRDDVDTREVPLVASRTALLVIDLQRLTCRPDGGLYADRSLCPDGVRREEGYFFQRLEEVVLPNVRRLQDACRAAGAEVVFTVIQSLTRDGRDRGLDYRITGFHVAPGSPDGHILDEVAPVADEMVLPKTSSSPFLSTTLHYVLGNLGTRQLIVTGGLTDQCVSSAVRDACDLGYLVTLVPDACLTRSEERHRTAIEHLAGYCRQRSTTELVAELEGGDRAL
jgi:ureidoacrylate peracid hydrolase